MAEVKKVSKTRAKGNPKTSKKATEVAVVEKNEVSVAQDEELLAMMAEDAGSGMEEMGKDDFAIPRLKILQPTSDEIQKRHESYIDGAEASNIMENVSNTLFDGESGIVVVPISYRRTIIEWAPRGSEGAGFIEDHGLKMNLLDDTTKCPTTGKLLNKQGNSLVETSEYYVFYKDPNGEWLPAVISMTGTQLKYAKRWNALMGSVRTNHPQLGRVTAPIFSMSYLLITEGRSNEKGSWFTWGAKKNGSLTDMKEGKEVYLMARDFKKQVEDGAVKVAEDVENDGSVSNGDDSSPM